MNNGYEHVHKSLDDYEPDNSIPEATLFVAHGHVRRSCVCGGWIEAGSDPMAIFEAVLLHNGTRSHKIWRMEQEP